MFRKLLLVTYLVLLPQEVLAGGYRTTATFYSDYYQGRRMSNGQRFTQNSNSVAHPHLRLGTRVKIKYKNRIVEGVVRDRCNCTIDLSKGLFRQLAPLKKGRISVKVTY
jgi:rare lipoprotein A